MTAQDVTAPGRVAVTCRNKSGPPFGPCAGCYGCDGVTGRVGPRPVTASYIPFRGDSLVIRRAILSSCRCPFRAVAVPFPGCRHIRNIRPDEAALDSVPGVEGTFRNTPPVKPFELRRRTTRDREFTARTPRTTEATP